MSPEQLRGDAGAVDVRTDVYALRVILWEVLAGRHPFGEAVDSVTRALQAGREPFAVGPRCAGRGNVSRRRSRGPLRIRRTVLDEEHQLLADAQFRLAECLLDVGKAAEVLALMEGRGWRGSDRNRACRAHGEPTRGRGQGQAIVTGHRLRGPWSHGGGCHILPGRRPTGRRPLFRLERSPGCGRPISWPPWRLISDQDSGVP